MPENTVQDSDQSGQAPKHIAALAEHLSDMCDEAARGLQDLANLRHEGHQNNETNEAAAHATGRLDRVAEKQLEFAELMLRIHRELIPEPSEQDVGYRQGMCWAIARAKDTNNDMVDILHDRLERQEHAPILCREIVFIDVDILLLASTSGPVDWVSRTGGGGGMLNLLRPRSEQEWRINQYLEQYLYFKTT
ncbi:hypothetical protein VTJ49DRAFT_2879 [Mycothermus thermophilus]|uniref:Uncharacterized protein n=1 Tax=Humicola insolens TaxID=85995 RepID=A0ABR3V8V0_HUMIN